MAEVSGLGHAGRPGWRSSRTPHYSKYGSYGYYRSRARPRSNAMLYALGSLMIVPLTMGAIGLTTRSSSMSQTVASRWSGKEFAKGFAWEAVPVAGSIRNLAAMRGLSGRAAASRAAGAVSGQFVWTAAYAYAAKTIATRTDRVQGDSGFTGSRGGSRRRRFQYEYAYKF